MVSEEHEHSVEVRKKPVSRVDLQWLTSLWEHEGTVPSCNMVMVMKLLLCRISRSGGG